MTETVLTTWKVYDYGIVDQATSQALYLGEVEATTFEDAAALARTSYPSASLPYIFNNGDEKGFI